VRRTNGETLKSDQLHASGGKKKGLGESLQKEQTSSMGDWGGVNSFHGGSETQMVKKTSVKSAKSTSPLWGKRSLGDTVIALADNKGTQKRRTGAGGGANN